jgi:hypothetical protein
MAISDTRNASAAKTAIDRPIARAILLRARQAVARYQITLWQEGGQYWGRCVELDCLGDGPTAQKCVKATRQAAVVAAAVALKQGEDLPPRAREGVRTEQVNVRLSLEEKSAIEAAANRLGYRGVSDYMRAAAIMAGAWEPSRPSDGSSRQRFSAAPRSSRPEAAGRPGGGRTGRTRR